MLNLLLMIFVCYLVGSLPTAIIAGKLLKKIDIREHGSGNAGATNVFRVLGWKAGLVVLLIDMTKGLVATILFFKLGSGDLLANVTALKMIAGISAVFGHIWTVFARFKGGKGVGTGAGMLIGLFPGAVLAGLIVFVLTVWLTRFVSLGSILASLCVPAYLLIEKFAFEIPVSSLLLAFGFFIPVLIILTHRSNVQRLLKGEENKIVFSKSNQ